MGDGFIFCKEMYIVRCLLYQPLGKSDEKPPSLCTVWSVWRHKAAVSLPCEKKTREHADACIFSFTLWIINRRGFLYVESVTIAH
ncbi:hypothetical protein HMPREF0083_01716 [Aneurinibacillus aneurinilyticus ATCC 12856]|uniref:Uncharacterized protein n=1 Tax=Aneurinibacillus aneurinilyticus ATCC 12856 TaxID=649747 RepID=U1X6M3_ANEAE|nr:hypothetical protein HMPREF0083_01716 [Aneurinibacillus aneurinilyticus ATCC 12856]